MIPAVEIGSFFLSIAAVLQFSSWAEAWLSAERTPARDRRAIPARRPRDQRVPTPNVVTVP